MLVWGFRVFEFRVTVLICLFLPCLPGGVLCGSRPCIILTLRFHFSLYSNSSNNKKLITVITVITITFIIIIIINSININDHHNNNNTVVW